MKELQRSLILFGLILSLLSCTDKKKQSFSGGSLLPSDETLITIPQEQSYKADKSEPASINENKEDSFQRAEEWELVWSDEFDYQGAPDPARWGYDTGGSGWGNHELQYYTPGDNALVEQGILRIEARKESRGGREYTSTRLISKNKGDWLYGRVEVRAKLPYGRGTWPAIWMLPTDWAYGDWPRSGEIDIMEHVGYDPDVVHGTVHTDRFNHRKGTQLGASRKVEAAEETFHSYAIEWYEDRILFFIDGQQYHQFVPSVYRPDPGYQEWPFDKAFHLLINIAVGGDWGGQRGVAEDIWPAVMEVDYVRVFQEKE